MDRTRRLSLLVTSPRVPVGLLSRQAWLALDEAEQVWCRSVHDPLPSALAQSGVALRKYSQTADSAALAHGGQPRAAGLAAVLVAAAQQVPTVWVGSADADPGLTDALAYELSNSSDPPELEIVVGSWDTPGSRLLDAVAVMDQLRSPGGCPWDGEQTHESLTPYLIEEAYECVEALETGTLEHRVEELGDVLLQVLFHARVGEEGDAPFTIDDIAGSLVAKLIRRHPHVFAGGEAATSADVEASWDQIKAEEKPERDHPLDGIPAGMPDLARASKVVSRLTRAGQLPWLLRHLERAQTGELDHADRRHAALLLGQVVAAQQDAVEPAAALRALLRDIDTASRTETRSPADR
ncbi:MAG: MazG family protein [Ornithinimicrobium sp.]